MLLEKADLSNRLTSFPILLCIAVYERHKKRTGAITFYEHVSAAAERVFDFLPKQLKRMCMYLALHMQQLVVKVTSTSILRGHCGRWC